MLKLKDLHYAHYYAQALYELAFEQDIGNTVLEDLECILAILSAYPTFGHFLDLTFIRLDIKHNIIGKIFADIFHPIIINFWKLLIAQNHNSLLPHIVKFYQKLADEKLGRIRATVTSAVPLKEAESQEIAQLLDTYYHQPIILSHQIDPNILGGLIIHVKDLWLDSSLLGHVQRIHRKLANKIQELAPTINFTND